MYKARKDSLPTRAQKAIAMDINNIGNKALSFIDKNATVIGVAGALIPAGRINQLQEAVGLILRGNIHAPDLNGFLFNAGNQPTYRTAVLAIVGGYVAEQAGIPMVEKVGSVVRKAAIGYLAASLAADLVNYSVHSQLPAGFITNPSNNQNIAPSWSRGYS